MDLERALPGDLFADEISQSYLNSFGAQVPACARP
jgi:hypothetical protein